MVNHIAVVIRGACERTEALCFHLVEQQISSKQVRVIHERPFAIAHEKSIRTAIEMRAKWSVFVDADILLRSNALHIIQRGIEQYESAPWFKMNFAVLDRGFMGLSYAGVHCYRTELFAKATGLIGKIYEDQRPETRLANEMGKRGYPTILSTTVIGLHDYEQYYRDLYRKMYVRGVKFNRLSDYMRKILESRYSQDGDARVMLWGLMDGLLDYASGIRYASLDHQDKLYSSRSSEILSILNLTEKEQLDIKAANIDVDRMIDEFVPDSLYLAARQRLLVPENDTFVSYKNGILSWKGLKKNLRKLSAIRTAIGR